MSTKKKRKRKKKEKAPNAAKLGPSMREATIRKLKEKKVVLGFS